MDIIFLEQHIKRYRKIGKLLTFGNLLHNNFLCTVRAYHGHTAALIDISPYKFHHLGEKGKRDYIHVAPTPDPYRGIYQGEATPELGEKYALEVKKLIDQAHRDGKKVLVSL